MVSVSELSRIEEMLRRGERDVGKARICKDYIGKIRRWLSSGESSVDVRRKLEQLISRYGNARY